jgi:hypothetical protein
MEKKQFKALKKQVEFILEKAEGEALESGESISSPEAQEALGKVKSMIVEKSGFSVEEYNEMDEKEGDSYADEDTRIDVKLSDIATDKLKNQIRAELDEHSKKNQEKMEEAQEGIEGRVDSFVRSKAIEEAEKRGKVIGVNELQEVRRKAVEKLKAERREKEREKLKDVELSPDMQKSFDNLLGEIKEGGGWKNYLKRLRNERNNS